MFNRALVLSIIILCLVAATLPITNTLAHWSTRPAASGQKGRHVRRHSRAWWRRHRARLRRQRAFSAERRRRRALMLARRAAGDLSPANHASTATDALGLPVASMPSTDALASITPVKPLSDMPAFKDATREMPRPATSPLPRSWMSAATRAGEMRFNVRANDGRAMGSAVWSRVNAQSAAASPADARSKTFGGVPVTQLRRTVINRMVAEGGWVVNDVQRQFGEQRIFVVTAQSGTSNGERRSWTFYFTESEGQVYSLATSAPAEFAETLAAESEQVVVALGAHRANATATTAQAQR